MLNKLFLSATVYALRLVCAKPYHQFQKKLMQPCIAQDKLLKKLIKDLSKTEYGKQYHITGQETYAEFSRKLPIQTYATMEPWIDRQLARPTERVITPYRIIHTEPTSGSSGAIKLIPYTLPLVQSFSSMFGIWVFDQLQNGFKPSTGRMFISISPASGTVTSGFSSDTEYLREPLRSLLAAFLVFPPKNNFTKNMDKTTFYDQLAITLLTETDLEIISIWSPSYWLVLLEYIQSNRNRFALLLPIKQRNILLAQTINWEALWPRLKLISCWADALSKPLANQLVNLFPSVQIQGKGLLATEAPISIPLISASGHLPLLGEVFLEFETDSGALKRLHELSLGETVQIILTQQGGLTRYRLNDWITVSGFYQNTPAFTFIGRSNQVCDLAGEKLNEQFVRETLIPLFPSGDFLLVPYQEISKQGYILLSNQPQQIQCSEEMADQALCQAYHYNQARLLRQIAPVCIRVVPKLSSIRIDFYQSTGMKLGNIKDSSLINNLATAKALLTFINEH